MFHFLELHSSEFSRGRPPPSLSRSVPWPCRKCGLRLFGATAVALGTWRSDPLWSRAHLKEETLRCVSFCFPLPPLGRPACWGPRTARPVAGSSAEEERPASCNLGQSRLLKRSASLPIPRLRSFYKYWALINYKEGLSESLNCSYFSWITSFNYHPEAPARWTWSYSFYS